MKPILIHTTVDSHEHVWLPWRGIEYIPSHRIDPSYFILY